MDHPPFRKTKHWGRSLRKLSETAQFVSQPNPSKRCCRRLREFALWCKSQYGMLVSGLTFPIRAVRRGGSRSDLFEQKGCRTSVYLHPYQHNRYTTRLENVSSAQRTPRCWLHRDAICPGTPRRANSGPGGTIPSIETQSLSQAGS